MRMEVRLPAYRPVLGISSNNSLNSSRGCGHIPEPTIPRHAPNPLDDIKMPLHGVELERGRVRNRRAMYNRDYLIQLIEQLGLVLARVLGKAGVPSAGEPLREIDDAGKMFVGLSSAMIASFSDNDLITILRTGGTFDTNKCIAISEIQYAEGRVLESARDGGGSRLRYQRALHFLLEALIVDPDLAPAPYEERISELLGRLNDVQLPRTIMLKLFKYYENRGAYALAENVLFDMCDAASEEVRNEGTLFYQRLMKKSDDELLLGNLPRSEVEEGLREFLERISFH